MIEQMEVTNKQRTELMIALIKVMRLKLCSLVGDSQTASLLESASQSFSGACKSPSSVTQSGGSTGSG